jgi:hypothetical protein
MKTIRNICLAAIMGATIALPLSAPFSPPAVALGNLDSKSPEQRSYDTAMNGLNAALIASLATGDLIAAAATAAAMAALAAAAVARGLDPGLIFCTTDCPPFGVSTQEKN